MYNTRVIGGLILGGMLGTCRRLQHPEVYDEQLQYHHRLHVRWQTDLQS